MVNDLFDIYLCIFVFYDGVDLLFRIFAYSSWFMMYHYQLWKHNLCGSIYYFILCRPVTEYVCKCRSFGIVLAQSVWFSTYQS